MNLHKEFVSLNFQIIGMKNRLMSLLLEIYEQEIYKQHGCTTIYEYAFKYARLSKERVQKALRTLRNTENTPLIRAKIETCGLDKVALVARLATPETQHVYAEHVENMSTPALQAFIKEIRQGKPEAQKMTIELDEEAQVLFNQLKKRLASNLSNQEALKLILKSVFEDAFSKIAHSNTTKYTRNPILPPDAHPFPSRTIPVKIRKTIQQRTNNGCAYPHCTKPIENLHHTTPFAFNRSHENIVSLCKIHHELCHNGVIQNEFKDPQYWQVNLTPHRSLYDNFYLQYKTKAACAT